MPNIVISYRRDDSEAHAGRIYDRLEREFGRDHVFMDVDRIEPGEDFVEEIEKAVSSCDVLIAVIGPAWTELRDDSGALRIAHPLDFVRMEVSTALRSGTRVIPVLVGGASMPSPRAISASSRST